MLQVVDYLAIIVFLLAYIAYKISDIQDLLETYIFEEQE